MNEGAKQAYLDKMSAYLSEWAAKIDVVKAKIAQGTADVRIDYHNQIEVWQAKEPVLIQKMNELRLASADGFETMKSGVQNVWNEIKTIMDSTEDKKNEKHQ